MNTSTRARRRFPSSLRVSNFDQMPSFFFFFSLVIWFNVLIYIEKAFGDDGSLKQSKELSINKVGHGLHILSFELFYFAKFNGFSIECFRIPQFFFFFLSLSAALHEIEPVFRKFTNAENISNMFRSLGYKRPVVIQSMYIFKVRSALWPSIFDKF